ncbi:MAG: YdeI/OmpD-associated family protein [Chitinophagales bacterium]
MDVLFFKTQAELRKWFQKNHLKESEAWIGFYNKKSGKQGISWQQLVDEELCFGWIDGIRKKIGEDTYCNRITPRKKRSNWSNVNIKRIQELMDIGLVCEQGKHVFHTRDLTKQNSASFEQEKVEFPDIYLKTFKANKVAWKFFDAQTNTYKKQATWYVISAKQEETRLRRLEILINDSKNLLHIKPLRRNKPGKN